MYGEFSHQKWWFSTAMFVCQRVLFDGCFMGSSATFHRKIYGAAGKHVDCCFTINQHRPILNGSHLPLGFIIFFTRVVDVYSIAIAIPSLKMSTFIPTTGLLYSQLPHHISPYCILVSQKSSWFPFRAWAPDHPHSPCDPLRPTIRSHRARTIGASSFGAMRSKAITQMIHVWYI